VDKNSHIYSDLIEKLIQVIGQQDISGSLFLAGGKSYLYEKAYSLLAKREKARLHHAISVVFARVQEAQELQGDVPYWDRVWTGSSAGNALCKEYETTDLGGKLRSALEPHPLEDIQYAKLCHLEAANDVIEADAHVKKTVDGQFKFKVVSVAPREDPTVIWSNLIYVRSDSRVENQKENDTSVLSGMEKKRRRRQRKRRIKEQKSQWELIASVDFSQHGSALPGHWHLNRTSGGDLVPHLSLECGQDKNNREVWHGNENCCPLWWHFIPIDMSYKEKPQQISCKIEN
jgi:hypothetical protein